MIRVFSVAALLSIFFSCVTPVETARSTESLERIIEQSPVFNGSLWSYCAGFVDTGIPLYSHNADLRLSFGSGQKILTTAAALDALGPDWCWDTEAFLVLTDKGEYDLVINGNGDPTICSRDFFLDPSEFTQSLAAWLIDKKVDRVRKILIADRNFNSDPKDLIAWANLGTIDSRPGGAFNWADNLVFVKFKRQPGSDATVLLGSNPQLPAELFDLSGLSQDKASKLTAIGHAYPGTRKISFSGAVPDDGREYIVRTVFPDPLYASGLALKSDLIAAGIRVQGEVQTIAGSCEEPAEPDFTWRFRSPPLKDVLYFQNKKSSNFIADQTGRALAIRAGLPVSLESAAGEVMRILGQWDLEIDTVKIYDATGISRENSLTSNFMFSVFCKAAEKPWFQDFLRTLPAPGPVEHLSPLADFFKGTALDGRVFMKSGTLIGVRSFSGYLKTKSGSLAAFSFSVNNYLGDKKQVDVVFRAWITELDRLLEGQT